MPKLLSLNHLLKSTIAVVRRFPAELLFAFTGTIAGTVLVEVQGQQLPAEAWSSRFIMMANLGLLLSFSATLWSESRQFSPAKKALLRFTAIALAVGLLFIIDPAKQHTDYARFLLFSLSFHLLVSFVAFNRKTALNGFWQFNKTLFLRFLAGGLYAAVLFAGLSAAIGSMNFLFGFDFEWDTFVILWVWIVGLFLTVFFLAGVPADFAALETETSYPKGLKVFTQYVLIPLATVYVLILLAYELKILIQWNLPKGLVSNLILGYAVFGILSLLLVFPIRNEEENKWIRTYSRSFYLLLLPLIVLLIVAVLFRVLPYGITVPRYFLLVLAGWLMLITFYFLFSKEQNIRIIPVSLAIFTLLTVYGPQSAISVAESSQLHTLKSLFKKYGAFDGKYLKALNPDKIDSAGAERIRNVAGYLVKEFGLESVEGVMKTDLQHVSDSIWNKQKDKHAGRYSIRYTEQEWLNKHLNIPDYASFYTANKNDTHYVLSTLSGPFSTKSARYFLPVDKDSISTQIDGIPVMITREDKLPLLAIRYGKSSGKIGMTPLLDSLEKHAVNKPQNGNGNYYEIASKYMKSDVTVGGLSLEIYWTQINYNILPDRKKELMYFQGYMLIK